MPPNRHAGDVVGIHPNQWRGDVGGVHPGS
jgi:hypothetical protein